MDLCMEVSINGTPTCMVYSGTSIYKWMMPHDLGNFHILTIATDGFTPWLYYILYTIYYRSYVGGFIYIFWLVVSTPLKNISQLGLLFPYTLWKIENVPNHRPVYNYMYIYIDNPLYIMYIIYNIYIYYTIYWIHISLWIQTMSEKVLKVLLKL
jgi:hypothetical protein